MNYTTCRHRTCECTLPVDAELFASLQKNDFCDLLYLPHDFANHHNLECLATRAAPRSTWLKRLSVPMFVIVALPVLASAAFGEWLLLLSPLLGLVLFGAAHPVCHHRCGD